MKYLDLTVDSVDAEDLRQQGRDFLQAQGPAGFVIPPLLDLLLGAVARMAVVVLVLAGQVPQGIFKAFGIQVLRIDPLTPTAANGTVTIKATAAQGGTLDAGATLLIDGVAFTTLAPLTLAAGASGTVTVQALGLGSAGNVAATSITLAAPSTIWVDTITAADPMIGGTDGETDDDYVDRLADEIPTLTAKAVHIDDAPAIARQDPEVFRAMALDNYDASTDTSGVAGHITVAVMNDQGTDISTDGHTRVASSLADNRILQIVTHVIGPTETAMQVAYAAQCYSDLDPDDIKTQADQALMDFLSALHWGIPDGADDDAWVDEPTVSRFDLVGALYRVPGIRHVSALTLATTVGTLGTADVTLTGPAGVPTLDASNIDGTVTI